MRIFLAFFYFGIINLNPKNFSICDFLSSFDDNLGFRTYSESPERVWGLLRDVSASHLSKSWSHLISYLQVLVSVSQIPFPQRRIGNASSHFTPSCRLFSKDLISHNRIKIYFNLYERTSSVRVIKCFVTVINMVLFLHNNFRQ